MLPSLPLRSLWPLLGLTASTFVFNTSEFMPIALLMDISRTFGMQPENTGIMITVYAWMVGLLSLPLMLIACHMRPRRLLLLTMLLFTAGQAGSGLAPNFFSLMGARILVACAHSIYWSIVAPLATRLVPPAHQPFALSMIATGTSIAMILGLPLGRLIGLIAGWRLTFFLIGTISFLAFLYLGKFFPDLENGQAFTLQELPAILKNPVIYGVFFMSLSFATAYYTAYSYVEPYLAQVARFTPAQITGALVLLGCSGFIGSFLFTKQYGSHRLAILRTGTLGLSLALALWLPSAAFAPALLLLAMVLGTINTLFNVTMQAEIIRTESLAQGPIAMSIFSGLFNVGIGGGTFIGGRITAFDQLPYIGFYGAAIAMLGGLYCLWRYIPTVRGK